ncbi:hypothetical protein D3C76_794430 [compost metagenome]
MKSLTVLLIASVLSFGAQAADTDMTNCNAKIKSLDDTYKADGVAIGGGKVDEFQSLVKQAKEAQAAGDIKGCNAAADRAQTIYNTARGKK